MDSLGMAVSVIISIFRWIFKSLGGKRVAASLSLLFFPLVLISIISEPNAGSLESVLILIVAGFLTASSVYAILKTQFLTTPLSACNALSSTSTWISIIGGYLILIMIFGIFILTIMVIAAVTAAFLDTFGINSR